MCMFDDSEPNEFYSEDYPKARKEHQCGECFRSIAPGESYMRAAGKSDGSMWAAKVCQHCETHAGRLLMKHCHGYLFGGMEEDLRNHLDPILPWRMKAARAVVGMRRRWQRFDGSGLMRINAGVQAHE